VFISAVSRKKYLCLLREKIDNRIISSKLTLRKRHSKRSATT